jgi:hypothetical protein
MSIHHLPYGALKNDSQQPLLLRQSQREQKKP